MAANGFVDNVSSITPPQVHEIGVDSAGAAHVVILNLSFFLASYQYYYIFETNKHLADLIINTFSIA